MRKEAARALEDMFQQADNERIFLLQFLDLDLLIDKSIKYDV